MKQTPLLRWIEAAEARSICTLAEENPARAIVAPASRSAQPLYSLGCGNSCAWERRPATLVPSNATGLRNALRFWRRAACRAFSGSRNAALSVSAVLPCVGATQAVGQRVTSLLRRKSDIAASYSVCLIGRISRRQVSERA